MSQLKEAGFEYYHIKERIQYAGMEKDLVQLQEAFDYLPSDEYAPHLHRFRRYARALVMPGTHDVKWLPETRIDGQAYYEYFQGSFNPEYMGEYRRFPSLDKRSMNNKLLEEIIKFDFKETFWMREDALMPFHAGVHFVKLQVEKEGDVAVSSPNTLHQDGEPFTFAHLIRRKNISGAVNAISIPKHRGKMPEDIPEEDITSSFYLTEPLESYSVYDPLVTHFVGDVKKGPEAGPGERSAILIDFQPTVIADPDQIRSMRGQTESMIYV
ncbi:2OG-Fe dioxygenase family protein [Salibacterium aidingense]|uniref:2OG-Fe dioxygenase family protein n=1 Tax=Salibacterium aidingense TaxID=384933 RepID=UPI00040FB1A9|nr:2OG-Fe dioxygenase family protein [Salibacterium aidingense]